ncbi:MAG TPA: MG2 domain-containing protein [Steroidobacter sp.]|uniref:alpha-2-macroglobulin family protein n=1 Tax=Steroidobacter sp. TaxID=1978227 RepID=UPI002ED9AFFA
MKAAGIGIVLQFVAFMVFAQTGEAPSEPIAEVDLFSPQGEMRGVRQATARFTVPMVALGDPRLADPFAVTCPAAGKGRWADTRHWVYDFDADLPAGLSCTFRLRDDVRSLSGQALNGPRSFKFTTGGPAILDSYPDEGWQVDEEQIFLLKLAAPATAKSIEAHAHCVVDGIEEQIPLEVLAGEPRAKMLEERSSLGYQYFQLLWKDGRISNARLRKEEVDHAEERIAVVRCKRRLAPATQMRLHWGKGVTTESGVPMGRDQALVFKVRPAFTARVECTRANARAGCMPMEPVRVMFSAPVPRDLALAVRIRTQDGDELRPHTTEKTAPMVEDITFASPFPDASTVVVEMPESLRDDAGRALENASRFPLDLRIDEYPALARFPASFGILEAEEGGVLPVTLRNVEPELGGGREELPAKSLRIGADPAAIANWLERLREVEERSGTYVKNPELHSGDQPMIWREMTGTRSVFVGTQDVTSGFTLTKPSGQKPAEVIGIPLKQNGFYVVEIGSRLLGQSLLGRDQLRYVATSALVTNLAVHFNWGRESSSIWVTRLDNGQPVKDAAITIVDYCGGAKRAEARTDRDGIAKIATSLGEPHESGYCGYGPSPLLVLAQQDEDFSFTLSSWSEGIAPHRFGLRTSSEWQANIYHTVLDRALFRAGETVSMKHFLRRHDSTGMSLPASASGTRKVQISHSGSGQQYELEAQFDADGVAENTWTIPAEAKMGDYQIALADGKSFHQSAGFKVEQFRLPSMRASVVGSAQPLVQQDSAVLDLHVAYMSGGGASGLATKLRTVVEPRRMQYPGYSDYQFGGAPVKEGIRTGDSSYFYSEDEDDADVPAPAAKVQVLPVTLDGEGAARVTVTGLPRLDTPAQLTAELEYADANGELLTATGRVRLVPSELSVGIRRDGWVASSEEMRFRVVVLGLDGKPRAQQAVKVSMYQSTAYSYRKRLIGGFYAYETTRETKRLPVTCDGVTNEQGLVMCDVSPGVSGEVLVRAEAADAQQRVAGATSSFWVAGKDDWWFAGTQGDRMDVLPEKKEYEAGDTARFQVRMPFREATALVTVAREGVLSSFTVRLKGQAPIVEVPIADAYAPNVYVSVLAVRGRVERSGRKSKADGQEEVTALVDLNKPAYRLGMAKINVGWKPHRLNVRVTPDRSVYKVAEKAAVQVHVELDNGQPLPAGTEIALAAVDEALLDLAPNPTWDLLAAMMGERGVEVWTSTAQMQVVGKRHYGRKAVPHGGGGGRERDRAREQFNSLLLWQGRVKLDAQGNASLQVPLNDSLSSFRVVAVAHGSDDLFGTGTASIATSQDLMLLSGLPPLVREGDRFAATFTLRNTTDRPLVVEAQPKVAELGSRSLPVRKVDLPPGQARDVTWDVVVPVDVSNLTWDVTAKVSDGSATDRIKLKQAVIAAYPVRTYQATISQLTAPLSIPAERPAGSIKGRGGLEVTLRARLGDGLDGVREYMTWYRYTCLEQQLSRAVVLRDEALWKSWTERLPAYMDSDGLLKYFPSDWLWGDDTLTAYVLAIAHEADWQLLEQDKDRLINALTRFIEGKLVRGSPLPTADLTIRKMAAIEALSRYGAAHAQMLESIDIAPDLWPTSAVLDWLSVLRRVPDIQAASERREQALGILRSRLNFQGTTMGFSTERNDALWWLMISGDSNANRMLLSVLDEPQWREDIPRLVRGAMGRQQEGHWNTTVANAWGVLAMEKFSAAFESVPVMGATDVRYASKQKQVQWPTKASSEEINLPWQEGLASLDVAHQGTGAPWAIVRATAALPLDKPLSSGYKTTRTVTPIEQQTPGRWTRGDVARVTLQIEAQSDMSWVVVDDPVPAGATILGSGLGGQSGLMTKQERREGWAWLAFEERKFDAFRAYYRFVPKGSWTVEYTVRLNNPGEFKLPATRVEAMYAPEMFGEVPNAVLAVEPQP